MTDEPKAGYTILPQSAPPVPDVWTQIPAWCTSYSAGGVPMAMGPACGPPAGVPVIEQAGSLRPGETLQAHVLPFKWQAP